MAMLYFGSLSSLAGADELVPGRDYVQGQIILTFQESKMPAEEGISMTAGRSGVLTLDSLLKDHAAIRLKRLLKPNETHREAGRRLARTFLLTYRGSTDAQDSECDRRNPGVRSPHDF